MDAFTLDTLFEVYASICAVPAWICNIILDKYNLSMYPKPQLILLLFTQLLAVISTIFVIFKSRNSFVPKHRIMIYAATLIVVVSVVSTSIILCYRITEDLMDISIRSGVVYMFSLTALILWRHILYCIFNYKKSTPNSI